MTDAPLAFVLPPKLTAEGLKSRLGAHVALQMGLSTPVERIYYDTFDWRLYCAGLALEQDCASGATTWRLYSLENGEDVAAAGSPDAGPTSCAEPVPFFAADLPDGSLRAALEPLTAIRALLPLAHLTGDITTLRIFNKDIKTVVRVAVETTHLVNSEAQLPAVARLLPVRGYNRWLKEVRELLAAMPGMEPSPQDPMILAVETAGHQPGDYSSGLGITLDPDSPAADSARIIHRALFEAMERNEPGVRADIDSEFLHDFRVAVRRTRSALSQIRDVFLLSR
ncbi:MAG: CHAD domain-containing protein [Chloroflexota bacterium]